MVDVDRLIAYECGELSLDETAALFQELIDTGFVWALQGHYAQEAKLLIEAGLCVDAPDGGCPHLELSRQHAGVIKCEDCGAPQEP